MLHRCLAMLFFLIGTTMVLLAQPVTEPKPAAGKMPSVPDPIKEPEAFLQAKKQDASRPALIRLLQARITTEAEREQFRVWVNQLGNDDFDLREKAMTALSKAGMNARRVLRESKDMDEEVRRRVEVLNDRLDASSDEFQITQAALILLSKQPSSDLIKLFLNYRESTPPDEFINDQIRVGLIGILKQQKMVDVELQQALKSPLIGTRTMVGLAVAEGLSKPFDALQELLRDPEPRVRFEVSRRLLQLGYREAMPTLFDILGNGGMELAYEVEDLFAQLTDENKALPVASVKADPVSRKQSRDGWETWWKANESKVDLISKLKGESLRGLTLVLEVDGVNVNNGNGLKTNGRVWECGMDGQQRWEWLNVDGPVDIQVLPGGRYLLSEYYPSRVTERNREGEILWKSPQMPTSVASATRLSNGNTIIATMNDVFEVTPDGKQENFPHPPGTVYQVRRGRSGNVFILAGSQLVEYSADRKVVQTINVKDLSGWAGFDVLPGGNFLIAYYNARRGFSEIDSTGKPVWSQTLTNQDPTRIQKLRNGHILVAGGNQPNVIEYDSSRKEVWKVPTKGRPFGTLRY
jgi:hypothetical protein